MSSLACVDKIAARARAPRPLRAALRRFARRIATHLDPAGAVATHLIPAAPASPPKHSRSNALSLAGLAAFSYALFVRRHARLTCAADKHSDCPCNTSEVKRAPKSLKRGPPMALTLKAGEEKWLCSCGKSKNFPFCDGSHKGSSFKPFPIKNDTPETKTVYACTCGHSKNPAGLCDGSHRGMTAIA